MTISKDLFLSILAMDSYNQGYNSGVEHGVTQIGSATKHKDSSQELGLDVDKSVGFYAVSYNVTGAGIDGWGGETKVISYRGTDTSLDQTTGWIMAGGLIGEGTQAPLALDFYMAAIASVGWASAHAYNA